MTYRDPKTLPRRDARGRFLEAPAWLRFGPKRPDISDYFWNGQRQRRCTRDGCRQVALRRSEFCRHHDVTWRRKRLDQLRRGKGRPSTLTESARLFRADLKKLWCQRPWWPGASIWFAPAIEAEFIEDCRRTGLYLSKVAPVVVNNLRWSWRRSVLNHDDDPGWQRALVAARKRQAKIGEPPDDFVYEAPSATPPDNPRIKAIKHRASAFEPARTKPVVDRATKAKLRRQKVAVPKTPDGFDWRQFLQQHWLDTLRPLWRAYRLDDQDVDGEVGRVLAITYKDKLDELSAGDGTVGPASRRWDQLLRQLGQGVRPGRTPAASRQLPPIAPALSSRVAVVAPDNDAWLKTLIDRVDQQTRG